MLTPGQSNVLVNEAGHALIANFGHATVGIDPDSVKHSSNEIELAVRWAAPEVLRGGTLDEQGEIFSFAMLAIEVRYGNLPVMSLFLLTTTYVAPMQVFTDAVPFSDRSDHIITMELVQGRRPPRPKHPDVTGRVWRLIQRCWHQDPRLRPEAEGILRELRESSVSRSFCDRLLVVLTMHLCAAILLHGNFLSLLPVP